MPATYFDVTAPAVFAAYTEALDKSYSSDWLGKVTISTNQTDLQVLKSIAIGSTRGLTTWVAGALRQIDSLNLYNVDVNKDVYQNAFGVPRQALKASLATSQDIFGAKALQLGNDTVQSQHRLLVSYLNTNPTDWHGVDLLGSHQYGSYAAQTNVITASQVTALNVTDPTKPTILEAAEILLNVAFYAQGFKNEYDKVSTGDAKKFVVLCNTADIYAAFVSATAVALVQGTNGVVSNPLVKLIENEGYSFEIVLARDFTGSNAVLFMRSEDYQRPVILAEEPIEYEYLDAGSEYAKLHDECMFGVKKVFAFAPGRWTSVIKATMS